eukprot:CAMPEP_0119408296 /NCGR_PEP_ID=MMETSP1335-20130426/1897_1 /TAXON_ID=259385 /ORGANISM="Chrysoculter rhomboideus, Strain RCC1486" /LENGTH=428 /DNA_ID=CAMNT_0007432519 /DNA_START=62 /DNA_END=1348 /DNA_ORIENTATION=-
MFGLAYNAYKHLRKKQERRMTVILLGVDNAGKSTLLHTLRRASAGGGRRRPGRVRLPGRRRGGGPIGTAPGEEEAFTPTPTIGFEEQSIDLHGQHCTLYDLGGSRMGRTLWPSYLDEVHGVVFVVDAADSARLEEVKEVLHNTLRSERIAGKPVLILCNKQDLPGALAPAQVAEALALHEVQSSAYQLFAVTARDLEDAHITKGLKWLGGAVHSDYAALQARIERDVTEKKRVQELERAERKRRIEERKAQREKERLEQEAREKDASQAAEPIPPAQPGPQIAPVDGGGSASLAGAGSSLSSGKLPRAASPSSAPAAEVELTQRGMQPERDGGDAAMTIEPAAAPRQAVAHSGDPAAPSTPGGGSLGLEDLGAADRVSTPGGDGVGRVAALPNQIFRTPSPDNSAPYANPAKKLPSLGHTPSAPPQSA